MTELCWRERINHVKVTHISSINVRVPGLFDVSIQIHQTAFEGVSETLNLIWMKNHYLIDQLAKDLY